MAGISLVVLAAKAAVEAAQEAWQPQQREPASGAEEGDLEVLREEVPRDRLGSAVVIGEVAELREQRREVPAGDE